MLLVKAFLKIFGVCSKLMKFALKRRKFAFLNRNKDADWREGENKKEVAAWSVSSPSPSPSVPHSPFCRYATSSPGRGKSFLKGRGLGSPFAQKEKEKFTKKCKIGCVLVQNVVSYKGVQK